MHPMPSTAELHARAIAYGREAAERHTQFAERMDDLGAQQ